MFLKKNERINGSRSITLALELTRKMAEVLSSTKLILVEFSVDAAKIQSEWGKPYASRVVRTDCEFVDTEQKRHVAIAWVNVNRVKDGRWVPFAKELFIKLDDRSPLRMEYTVPTTTLPLPDPIVGKPWEDYMVTKDPNELDYSRIR